MITHGYGTFENVAVIDGLVKAVQFTFNQTAGHTSITVPHFWYDAEFDPNFQVLLNAEDRKTKKTCNGAVVSTGGQISIHLNVLG